MNKQEDMGKVFKMLEDSWTGALLSAGISSGIFSYIDKNENVTQEVLAQELNFDRMKIDMWLYFAEYKEWVKRDNESYSLTDFGKNFSLENCSPDIRGLLQLSEYYLHAASQAPETFKNGRSLDQLSQGKISREYQPRVSDNFSKALKELFVSHNIKDKDSLLDVGCGNGSFLRTLNPHMERIELTGVDTNIFAIEKGKQKNIEESMSDSINLLVGDITEDMDEFPDNSFDWVTSVNVMHFLDIGKRLPAIENMIRIAKKGVFVTQVMIETTPLSRAANPLMGLLWNDYTGFFYKNEIDNLNRYLQSKYTNHKFTIETIMHGNSRILIIEPK